MAGRWAGSWGGEAGQGLPTLPHTPELGPHHPAWDCLAQPRRSQEPAQDLGRGGGAGGTGGRLGEADLSPGGEVVGAQTGHQLRPGLQGSRKLGRRGLGGSTHAVPTLPGRTLLQPGAHSQKPPAGSGPDSPQGTHRAAGQRRATSGAASRAPFSGRGAEAGRARAHPRGPGHPPPGPAPLPRPAPPPPHPSAEARRAPAVYTTHPRGGPPPARGCSGFRGWKSRWKNGNPTGGRCIQGHRAPGAGGWGPQTVFRISPR